MDTTHVDDGIDVQELHLSNRVRAGFPANCTGRRTCRHCVLLSAVQHAALNNTRLYLAGPYRSQAFGRFA